MNQQTKQQIELNRTLQGNLIVSQLFKNYPSLVEPEGSFLYLQEPLVDSILRHMNLVHIFTFCFTEILLNIIPSTRFLFWDVSMFEDRDSTFVETSRFFYPLTQRRVQEKRNLELEIRENRRTHILQSILYEICECA
jgi:hypothetical protein